MATITEYVSIITLAYLITGQSVTCVEVIKTDPEENVTVMWSIGGRRIMDIFAERLNNDGRRHIFRCFDIEMCLFGYRDEHITFVTDPPFNRGDPDVDQIKRIGFSITNVSHSDAGLYRFHLRYPLELKEEVILYVYQKPSKPVITRSLKTDEVMLTCKSTSQSLPEEYRNTSLLDYTWTVSNLMDNYDIDGDKIRIISPRKANSRTIFTCRARELNSELMSEESDDFVLEELYIENIKVTISRLSQTQQTVVLSCAADCDPECTYKWLNREGEVVVEGEDVTLENGNDMDVITCQASNVLATLSQSVRLNLEQGNERDVVIVLSVLLGLAIGVAVVVGVVFLIYKRREERVKTKDEHVNTKPSRVVEEWREPIYENQTVSVESANTARSTYDQLDRSRDRPVELSTYDVISPSVVNEYVYEPV